MDEKKRAELRKFLSSVSDAEVSAVIDFKKLYRSKTFNLAIEMAAEHAAKHHDFTYLDRILALLDAAAYANEFIAKLRLTLSFNVTETKPRKFKKASPEQVSKGAQQEQQTRIETKAVTQDLTKKVVRIVNQEQKRSAGTKKAAKKPVRRIVKGKVSRDLMDSWLMLPGGYGTGRRR